jgi:hypothetical protein
MIIRKRIKGIMAKIQIFASKVPPSKNLTE